MGFALSNLPIKTIVLSFITEDFLYWLLAATSAVMFLLCFLLAKNEPGKGGNVAVH